MARNTKDSQSEWLSTGLYWRQHRKVLSGSWWFHQHACLRYCSSDSSQIRSDQLQPRPFWLQCPSSPKQLPPSWPLPSHTDLSYLFLMLNQKYPNLKLTIVTILSADASNLNIVATFRFIIISQLYYLSQSWNSTPLAAVFLSILNILTSNLLKLLHNWASLTPDDYSKLSIAYLLELALTADIIWYSPKQNHWLQSRLSRL